MLKRSSRLKKRHTHVFRGLQGDWKSHARLPVYFKRLKHSSYRERQNSKPVTLSMNKWMICKDLLVLGHLT